MEKETIRRHVPFAITARATGHPRKLFTPLTVANLRPSGGDGIVATKVNAMWDTGAEVCLMSEFLARSLKVQFDKNCPGVGIAGSASVPIGYAYVSLLANGDLVEVLTGIVEETSTTGDYSFIIGLNLISKGSLAISSTNLGTTLSFTIPSPEPIDFTHIADIDNCYKGSLPLSKRMEDQPVVCGAEALELILPSK